MPVSLVTLVQWRGSHAVLVRRASRKKWDVFIQKLNNLTHKQFRKPKQKEWIYAAQGGRLGKGYKFSGSNERDEVAWHRGNAKGVKPVATKKPNELGIYDMSGNAWECLEDQISSGFGGAFPAHRFREVTEVINKPQSFAIDGEIGLRLVLPIESAPSPNRK